MEGFDFIAFYFKIQNKMPPLCHCSVHYIQLVQRNQNNSLGGIAKHIDQKKNIWKTMQFLQGIRTKWNLKVSAQNTRNSI